MKKANRQSKTFNEKQATVLGTGGGKKRILPWAIVITCVIFLIVIGGYVFIQFQKPEAVAGSNEIVHPVAPFDDGEARHFQIETEDGLTIKYFVLKSADGVIRAAFDACDVCWPAGKGYYQEGDHMVCRNCGRRFASNLVNVVKGGCNPAPLTRQVENGKLVIQIADLLEGKKYFNFAGKV